MRVASCLFLTGAVGVAACSRLAPAQAPSAGAPSSGVAATEPLLTPLPRVASPGAVPQPAQVVRFGRRPVRVGDVAVQNVQVGLELTTRYTQSGQIANEGQATMQRQQRRRIETLAVEGDRLSEARLTFELSRNQSPENPDPAALVVQPVEGKTYFVSRRGEEVRITDASGSIPPLDEFKLVSDVAENIGKPNPLAKLLLERPIAVGERLLVSREIAATLLGLRDQVGTVKRFELTLERLEPTPLLAPRASAEPPSDVAVFAARIETLPNDATPMELTLTGQVKIEVDTCRAVAAEFDGPVQMSTIERTRADVFQFSAAGKLSLAIRSDYDYLGAERLARRGAPLR